MAREEITVHSENGSKRVALAVDGEEVNYPADHLSSQGTLARLALGFALAGDLCARLSEPLPEEVIPLLKLLFPVRYQHAYLPDRY